ncbi:hypothetical protein EV672_107105 [Aquabacterium commune]|uniref:Secreted protein with PEP-CTERM sorting signal n=1 Tax=Aquabacterium commune TaxID=70586 RepID=A0A4R6R773_9BURK|nr:FxDxF family PEP-CTERM protein [Aquabacterium commune]TDP81674.1 hypothetical protein EV672_107105 [Aquabacterium commune]
MTRTRIALAAWAIAIVSATVSTQASANVINVVQADFGVISPLPYSRSFGDTFTSIAGTAGYTTSAASSRDGSTITNTGSIDGSVITRSLGPQFPGATANFNFYDDYVFTMPGEDAHLTASAVSVNFNNLLGINNLQARFYAVTDALTTGTPNTTLAYAWTTVTPLNGVTLNVTAFDTPLPLTAGVQYALEIRGLVYGPTASYGGNVNITPVPEADGLALALAGLTVAGWVASRRRSLA